MKKTILTLLTLCATALQARQITLIKTGTNNIHSLTYLSFYKVGNKAIGTAAKFLDFQEKKAVSFSIPDNHSYLFVSFLNAGLAGYVVGGGITIMPGSTPLVFKIKYSHQNRKITLTPVHLKRKNQ